MTWDAIVIGSGFGGCMAALPLVQAGERVLMIERGGWVARGPQNWSTQGVGLSTPHYSRESAYSVRAGRTTYRTGSWNCVGGQSVFYGGASYRFRARDFEHDAAIVTDSGAEWPVRYAEMEPFYMMAEELIGVSGEGLEPTAPWRSGPYPNPPAPLTESAGMIAAAARRAGLTPSRVPLAIAYGATGNRGGCTMCGTCDGYACAAEAKSDLASTVVPRLLAGGMTLRTNVVCRRLIRSGSRIVAVECVNRVTGQREVYRGERVILGAGTLATPHLLLASDLAKLNPAATAVGRYLTRHRNAVVLGAFARRPNPRNEFDKQVAIFDYYEAAGCIQQMTPPRGLARAYLPAPLRAPAAAFLSHASGLLVIAEDQPRRRNGVSVDWSHPDIYGLPRLLVHQDYSAADERRAGILIREAKRVLREAGALFSIVHRIETFSHALGTVRMGAGPDDSPLDQWGRFRGTDNLYVTDGSALPRSAAVNPSLTIAANALRIGSHIARVPATLRSLRRQLPVTHTPQPAGLP
jgi:choline dehydrogenase-like flavoprotein